MAYPRGHHPNSIKNLQREGRPRRTYSISSALSAAAELPESCDENGLPLTAAQVAAKWLWTVVLTGHDVRSDAETKAKIYLSVSTRDRVDALKTILSRIEPELKNDDQDTGVDRESEMDVTKLSDEQLTTIVSWMEESSAK